MQWDGNPNIVLDIQTTLGISLPVQVTYKCCKWKLTQIFLQYHAVPNMILSYYGVPSLFVKKKASTNCTQSYQLQFEDSVSFNQKCMCVVLLVQFLEGKRKNTVSVYKFTSFLQLEVHGARKTNLISSTNYRSLSPFISR